MGRKGGHATKSEIICLHEHGGTGHHRVRENKPDTQGQGKYHMFPLITRLSVFVYARTCACVRVYMCMKVKGEAMGVAAQANNLSS